jgi:repressor LexA
MDLPGAFNIEGNGTMAPRLTPKQLRVVTFIREFTKSRGYAPTLEEMGKAFGVSKITVYEHVQKLKQRGVLRATHYRARSVEVNEAAFGDRPTALPLVGTIAAGRPIEALEVHESIDVNELLGATGDTFLLRVRGDSMIDEHIRDGDYVLVQRRETARNGETVVALLPDGDATLKKFYREAGRIRLQPANPDLKPLFVKDVAVQGVVIGVLRKY